MYRLDDILRNGRSTLLLAAAVQFSLEIVDAHQRVSHHEDRLLQSLRAVQQSFFVTLRQRSVRLAGGLFLFAGLVGHVFHVRLFRLVYRLDALKHFGVGAAPPSFPVHLATDRRLLRATLLPLVPLLLPVFPPLRGAGDRVEG